MRLQKCALIVNGAATVGAGILGVLLEIDGSHRLAIYEFAAAAIAAAIFVVCWRA